MLLSQQDLFSDRQAITKTGASTQVIDLGAASTTPKGGASSKPFKRDLGQGSTVPLLVQVVEGFAGLSKLTIAVQTAEVENFAKAQTLTSQSFTATELKAGARLAVQAVPAGVQRYVRLHYTVEGTPTAGKITAGLSAGHEQTLPY